MNAIPSVGDLERRAGQEDLRPRRRSQRARLEIEKEVHVLGADGFEVIVARWTKLLLI